MTSKICVIGGDMRNAVAAAEFAKDGYEVCTFGMEKADILCDGIKNADELSDALKDADAVLLPVPFSIDGLTVNAPYSEKSIEINSVFEAAGEETPICGGMMGSYSLRRNVHDYFDSEELKILNAAATAESALMIGMDKLKITLNGAKALVIGYGRIGKLLSHKLKCLGANVTVVTRKRSDAAWCEAFGYSSAFIKDLVSAASGTDIIFNTVPAVVLDEAALTGIKRGTVIVDLASKPGGTDFEAAAALGIDAALYSGLPGRYVPVTAGKIIKNTVQSYIKKGK